MQLLPFAPVLDSTARTEPWAQGAAPGQPAPQPTRPGLISLAQAAWRRYRSRTLLAQLDDYMLKDIGVTRAEAQMEANKPFWSG